MKNQKHKTKLIKTTYGKLVMTGCWNAKKKKKTVSIYVDHLCLSGYNIQIDIDKSMVFYLEKHTNVERLAR